VSVARRLGLACAVGARAGITAAVLAGLWTGNAASQGYPAKPVRMVVGFAPGGATDILARSIAQKMSESWGQQAVVDNRPGASGMIAAEFVAKAAPDGHTLLVASPGEIAINPHLYRKISYDPTRDYIAVTLAGVTPLLLVVHPSVPARSVAELIRLARQKQGELTYASAGAGGAPHLAAEFFKSLARIDLVHVPYKGGAQAVVAMLAGEVAVYFSGLPPALPHVKTGRLRALAVTTSKRAPLAPDVPTFEESGLRGFDITNWFGVFVPAGTPPDIVSKIQAEIVRGLRLPDVRERLAAQGLEAIGSTPEELDRFVRAESAKYAKIINDAAIRAE
jgi:tripartite-type tricarboxylate transporter receptor subunit TctC